MNWTDDIEIILEQIRYNAVNLSNSHKKNYFLYKSMHKYFRIPTIILSSIGSVSAVGLQEYIKQSHISIITCLIGITIGIINSIELYLKINETIEEENAISKEFYNLSIDIHKILSMNRDNRKIEASSYLDNKYNDYTKLQEKSNLIKNTFNDKLTKIEKKESMITKNIQEE